MQTINFKSWKYVWKFFRTWKTRWAQLEVPKRKASLRNRRFKINYSVKFHDFAMKTPIMKKFQRGMLLSKTSSNVSRHQQKVQTLRKRFNYRQKWSKNIVSCEFWSSNFNILILNLRLCKLAFLFITSNRAQRVFQVRKNFWN